MVEFICECGKKVKAPDDAAGKKGKCPYCKRQIVVPQAAPQQKAATIICPQCSYPNEPNSKFCQECGKDLSERAGKPPKEPPSADEPAAVKKDIAAGAPPVPSTGVVIEFGHSSSADHDVAVQEASAHPTYATWGSKSKTRHRVAYDIKNLEPAASLWSIISRWKSSRVYLDGEMVPAKTIFGFLNCKKARDEAYRSEAYCFVGDQPGFDNFSPWGCIALGMNLSGWRAEWLCYGHWDRSGSWHFDKQRIHHELTQNWPAVRFCPHLQGDLINKMLAAWPDTANPQKDKDWAYQTTYEAGPNTLKLTTKEGQGEWAYESTEYANGVKPADNNAALRIWEGVLKKMGGDVGKYVKRVRSHA